MAFGRFFHFLHTNFLARVLPWLGYCPGSGIAQHWIQVVYSPALMVFSPKLLSQTTMIIPDSTLVSIAVRNIADFIRRHIRTSQVPYVLYVLMIIATVMFPDFLSSELRKMSIYSIFYSHYLGNNSKTCVGKESHRLISSDCQVEMWNNFRSS